MDYQCWNRAIVDRIFRPEMGGRRVYLYVNQDVIDELGRAAGGDLQGFVNAVRLGPPGLGQEPRLCWAAYKTYERWRQQVPRPACPSFVAYLALFVLAATLYEDMHLNAYYPRLHRLLGEREDAGRPPGFEKMQDLWWGLATWSRVKQRGELGILEYHTDEVWPEVGPPQSHALLGDRTRAHLPEFFAARELDPTSAPSALVLARELRSWTLLDRRARRVLEGNDKALRSALLEIVRDELVTWDGEAPSVLEPDSVEPRRQVRTGLKVCLRRPDLLGGRVQTLLRLKANRPFPDAPLQLSSVNGEVWTCRESVDLWSTPLAAARDGIPYDASRIDWCESVVMLDDDAGWRVRLHGAPVRVFVRGSTQGLSDWVESQTLPAGGPFYVAYHDSASHQVLEWAEKSCDARQLGNLNGLPLGWHLLEGRDARSSHHTIDVLQLPSLVRFALAGGIRTGRGNTYFAFAPPVIIADAGDAEPSVLLEGQALVRDDEGRWKLPEDLPLGRELRLDLSAGGKQRRSISFSLEEPCLRESYTTPPCDRFGRTTDGTTTGPGIAGVRVIGAGADSVPPFPIRVPTFFGRRLIFLGKRPGQHVDWPGDLIPQDWDPVWALQKTGRDRWRAHLVTSLDEATPSAEPAGRQRDMKTWRRQITQNGVEVAGTPHVHELWNVYRAKARKLRVND